MSETGASRFFRIDPNWRALEGRAFGIRAPAILGRVQIRLPAEFDISPIERALGTVINEKVPDLPASRPDERLVREAMHWTLALQRQMQIPVFEAGTIRSRREAGDGVATFRLALPHFSPRASMAAFTWVAMMINAGLVQGAARRQFLEQANRQMKDLGPLLQKLRPRGLNTYGFLAAAHERGIPVRQFMPGVHAFGTGIHSRWLDSSFTDQTSLIGARIANNKLLTAQVIRSAGLPAPTHFPVKSAEEAVEAARKLGFPVVVKPADRQQGRGVAADLADEESVAAAFRNAQKISRNILVEKHFEGTDYRMTVLNGRLFRVASRLPGGVTGDGAHTVAELVEALKQDPDQMRRARQRGHVLVELDQEAMTLLAEAGLTPASVPAAGEHVRLRRRGNVSAGGTPVKVDDDKIHPDNRLLAERAVAALRLDLGGVDVIMEDMSRSWLETGALICEVNAQPQIGNRVTAELLAAFIEGDARIPVLLVLGDTGSLDWPAIHAAIGGLPAIGFGSAEGAWLGADQLTPPQPSGFHAGTVVLNNQHAVAAIIAMRPSEVRRHGLPADVVDTILVTGPSGLADEERALLDEALDIAAPHAREIVRVEADGPVRALHAGDEHGPVAESVAAAIRRILDRPAEIADDDGARETLRA